MKYRLPLREIVVDFYNVLHQDMQHLIMRTQSKFQLSHSHTTHLLEKPTSQIRIIY